MTEHQSPLRFKLLVAHKRFTSAVYDWLEGQPDSWERVEDCFLEIEDLLVDIINHCKEERTRDI